MKIKTFWLFLACLLVSFYGIAQDVDEPQPSVELKQKDPEIIDDINDNKETELSDEVNDGELNEILNSELGENLSDELKSLVDQLLYVHVIVTMIPPGNKNAWTQQETRYTIPGKAFLVKIEGKTIKFDGSFVPFKLEKNYNLVAMSQIWTKTDDSDKMKFMSTFKMVTFAPGEKIFYYPLGLPTTEEKPFYSIKIEIDIIPYLDYKAKEAAKIQK